MYAQETIIYKCSLLVFRGNFKHWEDFLVTYDKVGVHLFFISNCRARFWKMGRNFCWRFYGNQKSSEVFCVALQDSNASPLVWYFHCNDLHCL